MGDADIDTDVYAEAAVDGAADADAEDSPMLVETEAAPIISSGSITMATLEAYLTQVASSQPTWVLVTIGCALAVLCWCMYLVTRNICSQSPIGRKKEPDAFVTFPVAAHESGERTEEREEISDIV